MSFLHSDRSDQLITSAVLVVFIRIWRLVMLTLQNNKPNTNRKSDESLPFNLHGSRRGLSFHLFWFICVRRQLQLRTRCTGKLLAWESEEKKNKKVNLPFSGIYMLFCCNCDIKSIPKCIGWYANGQVKFARARISSGILARLTTWRNQWLSATELGK